MPTPTAYSYRRFSSLEQSKGDSLRRQTELSEQYAIEHNLVLDDSLSLLDAGVSAYRGANSTEGSLGRFIEAVKDGRVASGSWLLVESLDRLSRNTVDNALALFLQLLQSGITVVTLGDRKVYSKDSVATNSTDLILSLLIFARANEESATKSLRIKQVVKAKRQQARDTGKPIGGNPPAWLQLSKDKTKYEVRKDRAKIVQRIYQMASEGSMGGAAIARELSAEGIPTFGKATYWCAASISRLLTNRATIGEYQPKTKEEGKLVASGDPILNYFPPVIPSTQFASVQVARESRRVGLRGRQGRRFSNLLKGITQCDRCGSSLRYVSQKSRENSYLLCSHARDNSGRCPRIGLRYHLIEKALLSSLSELDWQSLIANSAPDHKLQRITLQARLTVIEGHLLTAQKRTANLIDAIADGGPSPKALVAAADKSEQETHKLTEELSEAQQALQDHTRTAEKSTETAAAFTSAVDLLASVTNSADLYGLRAKVHHLLSQLIDQMYCSKWTPPPDVQQHLLAMMPDHLQHLFKHADVKNGGIILVRYRLAEDTLQLKARVLLINVYSGQSVTITETVPQSIEQAEPEFKPSLETMVAYLKANDGIYGMANAGGSASFYESLRPTPWLTVEA